MLRNNPLPLSLSLALLPSLITAQSFVGGDLSSQAPFSLPVSSFSDLTNNPNSNNHFTITGYDLSTPGSSSDATAEPISGWNLDVHLTNDVPLTSSTDNSVDKDQFFQATKISLVPPNGAMAQYDENNWRVCGIVFTAGLKGDAKTASVSSDGGCGHLLSDECIQQLQIDSVSVGNGTTDDTAGARNGGCEAMVLPSVCQDYFDGQGGGSAYEIKPINSSTTSAGRLPFFAAGSAPSNDKNDQAAIEAAQKNVWPVLLTWTHFGQSSDGQQAQAHDSAGWLSCVQAPNSTTEAVVNGDDDGKSSGAASDRLAVQGFAKWAGIVGLGVVGLAAVL